MEFEGGGPLLKPLLLIGGASSRMGTRKELLLFPDCRQAFEHALETLHSAVPSADTIYISLHDESQFAGVQSTLDKLSAMEMAQKTGDDHHHASSPKLEIIFDGEEGDIGPAAGLLAAYATDPNVKWLVLGCDYPLILEYQDPVTCFWNDMGFAKLLIAIWSSDALGKLSRNLKDGARGLNRVAQDNHGKLVKPLSEEWITGTNTKEEWDDAMKIVASRVTAW